MKELFRGAIVIGRRDFAASVFSKSFLLFLLAPLFPLGVMLIFGGLAVNSTNQIEQQPVVAVIADKADFAALAAARDRIAAAFDEESLVRLGHVEPQPDAQAQRQRLLSTPDQPMLGVLDGGLETPRFSSMLPPPRPTVRQLQLLVDNARASPEDREAAPISVSVSQCPVGSSGPLGSLGQAREVTAQGAQAILFVLTMLLVTMLLSQLIEEKSNKIIEVLAAAVPVGSIFLGKLVAMLGVSLLGISVWTGTGAAAIAMFASQGLEALPPPAVGWPFFLTLGFVYFSMSYLLLGAIFLGIGAHASSAREVQTLSMPVTMAQVVVFALAALAIGDPNGSSAIAAAIFPLSSPYVMIARAAQLPDMWPHLIAVLWQLLWVGLILMLASRLFRRSVLKSGPSPRRTKAVKT